MKQLTFLFLLVNAAIFAQTPTWSDKVANIIYNNCTECHRSGAIGPFTLESYNDAKANAFSIKAATSSQAMPPWKADITFSRHKGERILTPQQIADIGSWVDAGMPSGDLTKAPPVPTFPAGIKMQNPDQTITIPTYTVTKTTDDYRCFTINSGLTSDKYISNIEFEPKNLGIVHHILLYQDNAQTCKNLDNADPLPGYNGTGGGIGSNTATLVGGWVPGGNLIEIPQGMGIKLKANCYYVLQIHYAPGSSGKKDSTRCHFKFTTGATPREVYVSPILHHASGGNGGLTNGPLVIPANTTKTFNQVFTMDNTADYSIISVAPHMHYLGKSYKVYAKTPTNDTLKMVYLPDWDFHWQGAYTFRKIMKLPKSSKIYGEAFYDNTTNNPDNPSSPPKLVTLGEGTTDEMMLTYFTFTNYLAGDENIILDSTMITNGIENKSACNETISLFPNPVSQKLQITFIENEDAIIRIFNLDGREMLKCNARGRQIELNVNDLNQGIYFIQIQQMDKIITKQFMKL